VPLHVLRQSRVRQEGRHSLDCYRSLRCYASVVLWISAWPSLFVHRKCGHASVLARTMASSI
jgi:hypothetical protein